MTDLERPHLLLPGSLTLPSLASRREILPELLDFLAFESGAHPLARGENLLRLSLLLDRSLINSETLGRLFHHLGGLVEENPAVIHCVTGTWKEAFDVLCQMAQEAIQDGVMKLHDLEGIYWGLAKLKNRPDPLIYLLGEETGRLLNGATAGNMLDIFPQAKRTRKKIGASIANIAWASATLNTAPPVLIQGLLNCAQIELENFDTSKAAKLAWSLAVHADMPARRFLSMLEAGPELKGHTYQSLCQLHQAEVATGVRAPGDYSPEMIDMMKSYPIIKTDKPNAFEVSVFQALCRLSCIAEEPLSIYPHFVQDLIATDFMVKGVGKAWIIECDGGDFHELSDGSPPGSDIIQDKIFQRAGFEPFHIQGQKWQQIHEGHYRSNWLLQKLHLKSAGSPETATGGA